MRRLACLLALLPLACRVADEPHRASQPTARVLMHAVVSPREGILGRITIANRVILLTNDHRLVNIDVARQESQSFPLEGMSIDERLTGLATLPDGSLWTLSGWNALVRLNGSGQVVARHTLSQRHTGLHSAFGHLLYQPLDFTGGAPVLEAGPPGELQRTIWGTLRVAAGHAPGPVRLAQSYVHCGLADDGEVPCWFPNSPQVELIDATGRGRSIGIGALGAFVVRDPFEFAARPTWLIRDVGLKADSIWLLTRAESAEQADRRGSKSLWRVTQAGAVAARYALRSPARAIVALDDGYLILLTWEGDVVRVEV